MKVAKYIPLLALIFWAITLFSCSGSISTSNDPQTADSDAATNSNSSDTAEDNSSPEDNSEIVPETEDAPETEAESEPEVTAVSEPVAAVITKYQAGEDFVVYVPSDGNGNIAVKVTLPASSRYDSGVPVLINISTFFTPEYNHFVDTEYLPINSYGVAHVSLLWPGITDDDSITSEGVFDYGGENCMKALKDVIRYVSGAIPDKDGHSLSDIIEQTLLTNNIGLYAFSHPGLAAVRVLSQYGSELSVAYFVGRENPTMDKLSTMDLGFFEGDREHVNTNYIYDDDHYSMTDLKIDYSTARWSTEQSLPFFDTNGNGVHDRSEFIHGSQLPKMYDKFYFSMELTQALRDYAGLTEATWPADIATPEEAEAIWPSLNSVDQYPTLRSTAPHLKVMLVFCAKDHVQPSPDKPHIHQAFDGYNQMAGLWTRLNPDASYVLPLYNDWGAEEYTEHAANTEPTDWNDAEDWAYPDRTAASLLVPVAAVLEMADRTYTENWSETDLSSMLIE